jgi:branched-subunit amino acid transport protein AzlD
MVSIPAAALYTLCLALTVFFCRVLPFLFFREKQEARRGPLIRLFSLAEKTVPPAAMTVLAFNALSSPVKSNPPELLPVLAASGLTALIYLWKRNALAGIFSGTALYMLLERLFMQ